MMIPHTSQESIATNVARIIEKLRKDENNIDITVLTTNGLLTSILNKIDMLKGNIVVDEVPNSENDIMLFSIVGNDIFCQRAINEKERFIYDESKIMIVTGEVRADLISYHKKSNKNVIKLYATNSEGKTVNDKASYKQLKATVKNVYDKQ